MNDPIKLDETSPDFAAVKEQWNALAKECSTPSDLAALADKLTQQYRHDYGTVVHACFALMKAAFYVIERSPQGGITGFQANCLIHMLIKEFTMMDGPYKILDYTQLLYPQYERAFTAVPARVFTELRARAANLLAGTSGAPRVRDHWQRVANGFVPFGLELEGVPEVEAGANGT